MGGHGTYVHLWPIHVDICQKLSQYCKVIILQLKLIFLKSLCQILINNCLNFMYVFPELFIFLLN